MAQENEKLQQSNNVAKVEMENLEKTLQVFKKEKSMLESRFEDLDANKSAEIAELSINIDRIKDEYNILKQDYQKLKEEQDSSVGRYESELTSSKSEIQQIQAIMTEKQLKAEEELKKLEEALRDVKEESEKQLILKEKLIEENVHHIIKACLTTAKEIATRTLTDQHLMDIKDNPALFIVISNELQTILTSFIHSQKDNQLGKPNIEEMLKNIIVSSHLIAAVQDRGVLICNNSADIEFGERILGDMKKWCDDILKMFTSVEMNSPDAEEAIKIVQTKLNEIFTNVKTLTNKIDTSESISDLLMKELVEMDKSIDEAAAKIEEMLRNSRTLDSGIKLEVNEKILDACTNLMKCIQILVQKSRILQAEIVSMTKGTTNAKEFYKRNHQWTEGLISAAKNIAQGANFLV